MALDKCQSGSKLGKTIFHEDGRVLLAQGVKLTDTLIHSLKKMSIYTVYIEDEASTGIEIVDSIPEELRAEAVNVINDGLNSIAKLKDDKPNIQNMMRSDRAIRGFKKIFKEIHKCLNDNRAALNLLAATKIHENHVYTHSLNVTIYACQLAIANGLPLKDIEEIGLGAMLHDLGKLYIPSEILNKPGKLTEEEFEMMQSHSELGFDILRKIHEIPLPVSHCALQHHERIDGTGYPRRLKGDEIHKYAKLLSVADVFDAVTSHRVYRPPMLPHEALELLFAGNGTQFEHRQVQLFKESIAVYPPGLTVKLNDGRTGIVSKYNFYAVGRPEIRIIKDEENQEIKPYEIDMAAKENLTVKIVDSDTLL
ncbi:HD-GYP domain-containing protein [Ferdinandcohnia quinoae]|nr:HD-GYP domain-containing protein [Fredinandcohnia sp. SECRCQ15]